jgi:hypothetical protein
VPTELVRNEWSIILHHEDQQLLELRWLPSSATMTDGAWKATLALLALEAERVRSSFLLIDALQFQHKIGDGVMQWRDDAVVPRYGAAGVRKMAFHVPAGFGATMESGGTAAVDGPAIFPTAWFSGRENAIAWFHEG